MKDLLYVYTMEKQPTEEELEAAREQARADAEEPFAYAAEDVQAEYARVYDETLRRLRASV